MAVGHVVHAVSEGRRFSTDHNLEVVECPTCRIVYAIPQSLASSARAYPGRLSNGWVLCCPLGHEWEYTGKSIEAKLRDATEQLAAERADHDQTRAHLRGERIAKTRFKNDRDRLKQRVAHGMCPCCQRTFKQLARHMASQHPEYVEEAADAS